MATRMPACVIDNGTGYVASIKRYFSLYHIDVRGAEVAAILVYEGPAILMQPIERDLLLSFVQVHEARICREHGASVHHSFV